MYKTIKSIKVISAIIIALLGLTLIACWIDIAMNAGPNPTFANWNILAEIVKNA